MISIEDFKKLEIKIGTVISVERIEGADKLLKLQIDFGSEQRQILAGLAQFYAREILIGKQMPVIVNLEPRTMKGLESQGMILAAGNGVEPVLLMPEKPVPPGSEVR